MICSRIGSPAFAKTVAGREPPNVDLDPLSRSCDWRTWHATNTPVPLPMAADRNGSGGVPATWRPARRKAARRPRGRGHGSAHPPPRGSRGTPQAAVRLPGALNEQPCALHQGASRAQYAAGGCRLRVNVVVTSKCRVTRLHTRVTGQEYGPLHCGVSM